MANFVEDEQFDNLIAETAKRAANFKLSIANIAQAASASCTFEDGDRLLIKAQVAKIIPLTGEFLESAKANNRAEGYYVFEAVIVRNKKEISRQISLRQLYTPTIWIEAEFLDSVVDANGQPIEVFTAPFRDGKKRFGEVGILTAKDGVPYLDHDIEIEIHLQNVFVPLYLDGYKCNILIKDKYTALVRRGNYGIAIF